MAKMPRRLEASLGAEDYERAVSEVTEQLREKLEAARVRSWRDGDPTLEETLGELEGEVEQRWITGPIRALAVLEFSPSGPIPGAGWSWDGSACLLGAATSAMAHDVLACAVSQGWYLPVTGEERAEYLTRVAAAMRRSELRIPGSDPAFPPLRPTLLGELAARTSAGTGTAPLPVGSGDGSARRHGGGSRAFRGRP